jgi:hypothetical protein
VRYYLVIIALWFNIGLDLVIEVGMGLLL